MNEQSEKPNSVRLVFVSHGGKDMWVAKQIAKEIAACNAQPFLDESDINVGDDFEEKIRRFLEISHELLVLITPWSMERSFVWAEIGAAWMRQIPIIVVLLGVSTTDFQIHPNVPIFLKKRDIISINDISQYFDQLKQRVSKDCERSNNK